MGLEELEEQGVLLPEERWGEHELSTTVARWPLAATFALGVAALAAAYLGDGGVWTWVGIGTFLAALYAATVLCDRAIERQRERMAATAGRGDGGGGSAGEGEAAGGGGAEDPGRNGVGRQEEEP